MAEANGFALVFGAASGIGLESALTFAEKGARGVAFADRNLEGAQAGAEQAKAIATATDFKTIAIHVDVTQRESVKAAVQQVKDEFGRLDYAVNSAGIARLRDDHIPDVQDAELDKLLDINFKGILHCMAEEISLMKTQEPLQVSGRSGTRNIGPGAIVNLTSLSALVPFPGATTYTASKYAARALSKTAALENRALGLRVNEVCPAYTQTPMMDAAFARNPALPRLLESAAPLKRVAAVEEVAGAVHFLCTPAASFTTGQTMVIDSGISLLTLL